MKIFNDLNVHEVSICQISKSEPDYKLLEKIVRYARFPVSFGGGIRDVDVAQRLISLGVEKLQLKQVWEHERIDLITSISERFGRVAVTQKVDIKPKGLFSFAGKSKSELTSIVNLNHLFGEVFVTDTKRENTRTGCNVDLLSQILGRVNTPVVFGGGIASYDELFRLLRQFPHCSFHAGSLFNYNRIGSVLPNFPTDSQFGELYETMN